MTKRFSLFFHFQAAISIGVVERDERLASVPHAAYTPGEVRRRFPAPKDRYFGALRAPTTLFLSLSLSTRVLRLSLI